MTLKKEHSPKKEKQYDEEGRVIRENRTQAKREREPLKALASELLKLPSRQYALLNISDTFQSALVEGKRLTGNALARHLSFLTRLVEEHGYESLRARHEHINHPFLKNEGKTQQILFEIKQLIAGDADIFAEMMARYQDFDAQHVRQLVREIQKHQKAQSALQAQNPEHKIEPSKHQSALHKYLSSLSLIDTDISE
ncbi:MAG: ribosome biogenesis factor YjgA [Cardiobacteriaceae bacterium]|nr:ribosome biogenesis factor YjgA [Cardiobacteriaceae bacterium]